MFHSYDACSLDRDRHAGLIIRTVLAEGTWEQVLWLFREYGWDRVKQVVLADHHGLCTLPEPTRQLWLAVFSEGGQPASEAGRCEATLDKGGKPKSAAEAQPPRDETQARLERWRCRRYPPAGAQPPG